MFRIITKAEADRLGSLAWFVAGEYRTNVGCNFRAANYYADLDRAHRAPPATAAFILEQLAKRHRLTMAEVNADLRERFGTDHF